MNPIIKPVTDRDRKVLNHTPVMSRKISAATIITAPARYHTVGGVMP